jgi:hypothetical protein
MVDLFKKILRLIGLMVLFLLVLDQKDLCTAGGFYFSPAMCVSQSFLYVCDIQGGVINHGLKWFFIV